MARFIDSAIIIMLVAVVLFCSDAAYTHALLGQLMLDSDILERSMYSSIYHGFVLNLELMLRISYYGFAFALLSFMAWCMYQSLFIYFIKKKGADSKCTSRRQSDSDVYSKVKVCIRYMLPFLMLFIFTKLLIHHEREGIERASVIKQSIYNHTAASVNVNGVDSKLYHVYCGGSKCAAFDAKDNAIRYYLAEDQSITSSEIKRIYNEAE